MKLTQATKISQMSQNFKHNNARNALQIHEKNIHTKLALTETVNHKPPRRTNICAQFSSFE